MKALIFDSSSIITMALNSMTSILMPLKEEFRGKFLITEDVKKEVIDKPMQIKRFELEALIISRMVKKGVIEITSDDIRQERDDILEKANSLFEANGEKMKILHSGEASCIAMYNSLKKKGYDVSLVIDERTTRMLCENPENLRRLLEEKLHTNIKIDKSNLQLFKGINVMRSSELFFIAHKLNLMNLPASPSMEVDALLYAAKFNGCSISSEEIEEAKKMA